MCWRLPRQQFRLFGHGDFSIFAPSLRRISECMTSFLPNWIASFLGTRSSFMFCRKPRLQQNIKYLLVPKQEAIQFGNKLDRLLLRNEEVLYVLSEAAFAPSNGPAKHKV